MLRCLLRCLFLFLLTACSTSDIWKLDSIATGEKAFNSARLICSNQTLSPLQFEVIAMETGIESFLSLSRRRLMATCEDPRQIEVQFAIDGEKFFETVPLLEGRMRLRLPPKLTGRLIEALQEGKKIDILLDGFEQTLEPQHFSKLYEQMEGYVK